MKIEIRAWIDGDEVDLGPKLKRILEDSVTDDLVDAATQKGPSPEHRGTRHGEGS